MVVLGIDTATDLCGVSVCEGETVVFEEGVREPRRHAERLAPMIEAALDAIDTTTLDAISVSAGPGSYTGLRIGASAAKGLAVALDMPLATVPTLACFAMAAARTPEPETVVGVLRARPDEWYAGTYRVSLFADRFPTLDQIRESSTILSTDDLIRRMHTDPMLVLATIAEHQLPGLPDERIRVVAPNASFVAVQGGRQIRAGQVADTDSFEPAYLREFVSRTTKGGIFPGSK